MSDVAPETGQEPLVARQSTSRRGGRSGAYMAAFGALGIAVAAATNGATTELPASQTPTTAATTAWTFAGPPLPAVEPGAAEPAAAEPTVPAPAPALPAVPAPARPRGPAPAPRTRTPIGGPQAPTTTAQRTELVWSDEFDKETLDTSVWKPYFSTYGDGNHELQCHTPNNVALAGGILTITARRESITCPKGSTRQFSSGFLGTRDTGTFFPRYGLFEIRARLPHGQGLWPAFWLRHRNGSSVAEVDVMEYFHSQAPGQTTATLHLGGRRNLSKKTVAADDPANPAWHTWAVEIVPARTGVRFTFFLDGARFHTFTDTEDDWNSSDLLWDVAVNLSVGGDQVGHPDDPLGYLRDLDRCARGGTPPDACSSEGIMRAEFPATYEVDYVRVWDLRSR